MQKEAFYLDKPLKPEKVAEMRGDKNNEFFFERPNEVGFKEPTSLKLS